VRSLVYSCHRMHLVYQNIVLGFYLKSMSIQYSIHHLEEPRAGKSHAGICEGAAR